MKKSMTRFFAILFALVMAVSLIPMIAAKAEGNEIFVSNAGSDDNGDGSETNPYATIKKAYEESASGDTIVLLSDIAQSECVDMWHDVTIKSKDGEGPYTVTRQAGFTPRSDYSRSWYNPAMFEAHPDIAGITVTFSNIILDDNFLHEGTSFSDQPTEPADTSANLTRVQDGIIGLYNDPDNIYKCVVVLDNGTTLKNFGGVNAVNIEGHSELVMKSGSVITNENQNPNGQSYANGQAVYPLSGGMLTMEQGSLITQISGANAVFTNEGSAVINGEISECSGASPLRTVKGTITIGPDGEVHDLTGTTAALYDVGGSVVTINGKFHDISDVGVYPSCNSGLSKVYIQEHADVYNCGGMAFQSNQGSLTYMSGGSIHDNAIGVNIRKFSTFEMTGGTVTGNGIGLNLNKKSVTTARFLIHNGDVSGNTNYDYYIETTKAGYLNGSYLYLSDKMLADTPTVGMETNTKKVTIPAENTELYLGNASAGSDTALNNFVTTNFTGSTVLATWFAQTPESALHVTVSGLAAQTDPVYVISYPVDASGNPDTSEDPIVYAVTQDTAAEGNPIDVLASAGSPYGRSYAIFAAPDMWKVSYNSKGGTTVPTEAVPNNGNAHEPTPPTYRYRRFLGWYTDPDCTDGNEYDFANTPVTADITLYAKWELVTEDVDLSNAKIFKNVETVEGVTYDPITFTFNLEPYAVAVTPADLFAVSDMPAIGPLTITMSGSETRQKVTLPTTGFPIGGVYTYKVTEVDGGEQDWTYDTTEYYIDLEIEEDSNGNLVLDKIVVHKDAADGTKTDLEFNNIYAPKTTLEVSKTVTGDGDNPLNSQKEFTFTITFTDPGVPGYPSVATDGKTVSYGGSEFGKDEDLSYGVAYTFTLKNGEKIEFNLPVGTTYTVTEQGEEYYTPSANVITGGTDKGNTAGEFAADLTVGDTVEVGDNKVAFTNEYSITPPTGVKLNKEIIIIGAIILVFIVGGFVVTRRFRAARAR